MSALASESDPFDPDTDLPVSEPDWDGDSGDDAWWDAFDPDDPPPEPDPSDFGFE